MGGSKKKQAAVGRPQRDDSQALKEVRRILGEHPKWGRFKAALNYAERHPEHGVQPTSTARRLAEKLRKQAGLPPQRKARRRELLTHLAQSLMTCALLVEMLQRLDREESE